MAVGAFALTLAAGCAGLLVDARLHTQSGVTVSCRVSSSDAGPNLVHLDVRITPSCTSGDITTEVLQAGRALSPPGKSSKVIYADASDDVTTAPFQLPTLGTWLTVEITAICDRAGATKTGRDTCQVIK